MRDIDDLYRSMEAVTRDLGFRYFALIHHDDLSVPRVSRVDIKQYPPAIIDALYADGRFRRDPVARTGDQVTQRNLGVQPTITSRPGALVRLVVHKDLMFAPSDRKED